MFSISFLTLTACGGARTAHLAALEEADVTQKRLAEGRLKMTELQEELGNNEVEAGR